MTDLPRLSPRNMSEEVYDILKDRIISKQFSPGERLHLGEIERQMNVSRTPLKEALNRLALQGLVEIRPSRGTFVSDPGPTEIAQSFDVRRVLEMYAVELLAERMTEQHLQQLREMVQELRTLTETEDWSQIYQEYVALDYRLHRLIMQLAGNEPLKRTWEEVNMHVQMARVRYRSAERELDLAQEEHEELLRAFEARNVAVLQQVMSHHLERAKQSLLRDLEAHA